MADMKFLWKRHKAVGSEGNFVSAWQVFSSRDQV